MNQNPSISVIIPVLNEECGINHVIDHVRSLKGGAGVEIVVVDGDPSGSTIKAVGRGGIITSIAPKGRGSQMNRGSAIASGDILLFLHADTLLPESAFPLVRETMLTGKYAAGCFDLGLRTDRRIFRVTERYVAFRTRLTRIPFGDQAIFIGKDLFERLGGYRDIPVMEDVDLMLRIRRRGEGIRIIPEKVMTSARRWEEDGLILGTFRNWMLQLLYCCGVSPSRLARFYR